MQVEIIYRGCALRTIPHQDQVFVEVPEAGEYSIRLTNSAPCRRMAVVSVDGINVIDGADAGIDGGGYVLGPWESLTIKGFLRNHSECARFTFSSETGASYAEQTGRGAKNVGVIGVAVFDERPKPQVQVIPPTPVVYPFGARHPSSPWPFGPQLPNPWLWPWASTICSSGEQTKGIRGIEDAGNAASMDALNHLVDLLGAVSSAGLATKGAPEPGEMATLGCSLAAPDVGTTYGRAEAFHTRATEFVRAASTPTLIVALRYAVKAKLREWGVPVERAVPMAPNPFPASQGFAQAPAGWQR